MQTLRQAEWRMRAGREMRDVISNIIISRKEEAGALEMGQ